VSTTAKLAAGATCGGEKGASGASRNTETVGPMCWKMLLFGCSMMRLLGWVVSVGARECVRGFICIRLSSQYILVYLGVYFTVYVTIVRIILTTIYDKVIITEKEGSKPSKPPPQPPPLPIDPIRGHID